MSSIPSEEAHAQLKSGDASSGEVQEDKDKALVVAARQLIQKSDFSKALSVVSDIDDHELRDDLINYIIAIKPSTGAGGIDEAMMKRIVTGFLAFSFFTMIIIAGALVGETMGFQTQWEKGAGFLVEVIKIAFLPVTMLVLGFHFGKESSPLGMINSLLGRAGEKSTIEDRQNESKK